MKKPNTAVMNHVLTSVYRKALATESQQMQKGTRIELKLKLEGDGDGGNS
jgi:hypothetical protein